MKLVKYLHQGQVGVGVVDVASIQPIQFDGRQYRCLFDLLEEDDVAGTVQLLLNPQTAPLPLSTTQLLAPIEQQEVWAAGVTYRRSKQARMEESTVAASCYDRVYEADRPELFFKATPSRVSGPGQALRIRTDATWNVPEPELTLVLNSRLQIAGYTIGNDMSSRDIEGENPLYLPQAKVYSQCCGLGPCITLAAAMPPLAEVTIKLEILRNGESAFVGTTSPGNLARPLENLLDYLGRDNRFPQGVYLLTGTGIVPGSDFTLAKDDVVNITIDGIGTLSNHVVQG